MPTVEKITESCGLGEGPHWDIPSQSLLFIDVVGNRILKYTPSTKKLIKVPVGKHFLFVTIKWVYQLSLFLAKRPTFIIPVEGKTNEFLLSQENELVVVSWDGESENVKIVQKICEVAASAESRKTFNDAKCDSSGRLWTGNDLTTDKTNQKYVFS